MPGNGLECYDSGLLARSLVLRHDSAGVGQSLRKGNRRDDLIPDYSDLRFPPVRQLERIALRELRLSVAFAVRFRSAQCEKENVQVADDRQKKGMMDTDTIGNCALHHRENGSANDGHNHDSRAVTGKRTKFSHS